MIFFLSPAIDKDGTEKLILNPAQFPQYAERPGHAEIHEPVVMGTLVFPDQYLGKIIKLCEVNDGCMYSLSIVKYLAHVYSSIFAQAAIAFPIYSKQEYSGSQIKVPIWFP